MRQAGSQVVSACRPKKGQPLAKKGWLKNTGKLGSRLAIFDHVAALAILGIP